jgi:hypothetical protein
MYQSDTNANLLLPSLTEGMDFTIPDIDLSGPEYEIPGGADSAMYQPITKLTNADLTTGDVDGTGTFDVLMSGMRSQLEREYKAQRITGAEYTKAYIAMMQAATQSSVQYLLGRDQAYWQAQSAQIAAITAKVQLETAKVQLVALQLEALTSQATYALTKLKLATEDIAYGISTFQLNQMMPAQLTQTQAQTQLVNTQNQEAQTHINQMVAQTQQINAQTLQIEAQTKLTNDQDLQVIQQTVLTTKQITLVEEQTETARGSTLDTRTTGETIVGSIGKQKDLYTQQITSYQRDAEVKASKLFTDSWITQKSIDEGLLPPPGFENDSIDGILTTLKINNKLGTP